MIPLSLGQERFWLLQEIEPADVGYNMPFALRFPDGVDDAALDEALRLLVRRHPAFQSRFVSDGDGVPRCVYAEAFKIPLYRAVAASRDWRAAVSKEAQRPFDLSAAPPIRGYVVGCVDGSDVLCLVIHHILVDGRSMRILIRDLLELYRAVLAGDDADLPELTTDYGAFAAWQRSNVGTAADTEHLDYWRDELAGFEPLNLPLDRPRLAEPGTEAEKIAVELSAAQTARLRALALRQRSAMSSAAAALFQSLLAVYSGQRDITIGTVLAGRGRPEFANVIGFFANTVVLRVGIGTSTTFRDVLRDAQKKMVAALEHQDASFDRVVSTVQPTRIPGRSPVFDVLLVHHGESPISAGGSRGIERVPWDLPLTRYDLELETRIDDGRLQCDFTFRSSLFDSATAQRMAEHFVRLAEKVLSDPDLPLARVSLLDRVESPPDLAALDEATRVDTRTLSARFEEQVARTPDAVAVTFADGRLSYAELNARANRLGHFLIARGVRAEQVVGVLLDRSPEVIVAFLAILKAGGVYLPLSSDDPEARTVQILAESGAVLLLAGKGLVPVAQGVCDVVVLDSDLGMECYPEGNPGTRVESGQLACVLFTSGSTGEPKGVAHQHLSLAIPASDPRLNYGRPTSMLLHSRHNFDVSTFEIWVPLLSGGRVVVPPAGVLEAATVERLVASGEVDCLWLTAGLLRVFAEESPKVFTGLRTLWSGGDVVLPSAVARVLEQSPETTVVNNYGPTETTFTTAFAVGTSVDSRTSVPIGSPLAHVRCHVLGEGLQRLPIGVVGELYIGGEGVARGYLNRPGLTAERFVADPFGPPGSRMYRTGDQARLLADGNLDYIGRPDAQVKIRGFRIELGEIENAVLRDPAVSNAAVTVQEDISGGRRLIAYFVPRAPASPAAEHLRQAVASSLPAYMVPSVFVAVESLPLGPNGKVDRRALPAVDVGEGDRTGRRPRSPYEEVLCILIADVLGVDGIGVDADFFDLGGHSLAAIRLVSRVRSVLGVDITVRDVFEAPTAAGLSAVLARASSARPRLAARPRPFRLPLSRAQQRLWFLHEFDGYQSAYNVPVAFRLRGDLNRSALEAAFADLVIRHESLRTVFSMSDGVPYQRVLDPAESVPGVLFTEAAETDLDELLAAEAVHLFDLAERPPVRVSLFALGPDDHVLCIVIHHIAVDGWALAPLLRDLAEAYGSRCRGEAPSRRPLAIQYADYALWQQELMDGGQEPGGLIAEQLDFWRSTLAGLPEQLALPSDAVRAAETSTRAGTVAVSCATAAYEQLVDLARSVGATPFMMAHAAVAALLTRVGAGTDIPLGTVVAGRADEALDDIVGFFVNTLVLRTDTSGDPGFRELLERVRAADLAAFAHQDVPFERVVEELRPARSAMRNPLFQVAVSYTSADTVALSLPGLAATRRGTGPQDAKFDLTFGFREVSAADGRPGGLECHIEFSADLYTRATVERMGAMLVRLLAGVAQEPGRAIGGVDILDAEERLALLSGSVGVCLPPANATLPDLFEQQVLLRPEAVAVICGEDTLTYSALNAKANRLAHHLASLGAGPEERIAIVMPRGLDFVIAQLAVAKTGAAFVPVDPGYPSDRVAYVLSDARPLHVLTAPVDVERYPDTDPPRSTRAGHPAYMIYTSGSTGRPKGVLVTQEGIVNLLTWLAGGHPLEPGDVMLARCACGFDPSVMELWHPLTSGAAVCVAPEDVLIDVGELLDHCVQHGVSHAIFIPSQLAESLPALAEADPDRKIRIFAGGEVLPTVLAQTVGGVANLYGPTETTILVSSWSGSADLVRGPGVPIGRPVANTGMFVLDATMNLVPVGTVGELYVAGPQLARGYFGRPDLTAERFVANPYGEPGERMYRTGDLARWLPNRELDFLGRADDQVKIRGYRIEPGEIEAEIVRDPAVAQVAVVVREDRPGHKRLVAYIVPASDSFATTDLRKRLAAALPGHMVPNDLIALDRLPMTPHGKLDQKALPMPERLVSAAESGPRTPREEVLCGLFEEALGIDAVGIHDDFFEAGGHSLLAVRLVSRIRESLGIDLAVHDIFRASSVAALAPLLDGGQGSGAFNVLLPIRAGSGDNLLFCIHPVIGLSWCYVGFSRHLPKSVSIIGLQARGFDDAAHLPLTLEEMAEDYLRQIRALQPVGPYQLFGWSFGGNVAHAVATLLQAQGEMVSLLALADSYPSTGRGKERTDLDEAERLHLEYGALSNIAEDRLADIERVAVNNARIVDRYTPKRFDGNVLFVRAAWNQEGHSPRPDAWSGLVGKLEIHSVNASHFDLMRPEPLAQIARLIAPRLIDGNQ